MRLMAEVWHNVSPESGPAIAVLGREPLGFRLW
jgi:hypothetical protein